MIENAKWILCGEETAVPRIARKCTLHSPSEGQIEITGLGFFTLFINGQTVTQNGARDLFVPALTDYFPRDMSRWTYPLFDLTTHRVQYLRYDITSYLRDGENLFEIELAPGWYRQSERIAEGDMSFGRELPARYAISVQTADGTVTFLSDGTEHYTGTEVIYSNLFTGEIRDARLNDLPKEERPVRIGELPETTLTLQDHAPDRPFEGIRPRLMGKAGTKSFYDLGENISFLTRLTASGKPGDVIRLRYSEEKRSDTALDFASAGADYTCTSGRKQIQTDEFILSGKTHTFTTETVWHAARYIELEGEAPEDLECIPVHTAADPVSGFHCDNEVLNWLYRAYIRTQLNNLHGCIPSDCPHRERLGYTGDGQITAKAAMLTLDMRNVYRKWIRDILDCQDRLTGHVQHTAPLMGGGGGPGGWGCAVIMVPDEYDRHYDDISLLKECYPHMRRWIAYLAGRTENGLVVREEPKGWCLGDWASLYKVRIPADFVNTCCLLESLYRMVRIAKRLGAPEDAEMYTAFAERTKKAVRDTYYDEADGSYCGGVQAADAFALWARLDDDPRTIGNLVSRYRKLDYFDTGFLGTEILIDILLRNGEADLACRLLTNRGPGSFGHMMEQGATTVWEYFDGEGSHDHPMFAACVRHLFEDFLGIRQEKNSRGYASVRIEPQIPDLLSSAEGFSDLPCGRISVAWEKQGDGTCSFAIDLPKEGILHYRGQEIALPEGHSRITI